MQQAAAIKARLTHASSVTSASMRTHGLLDGSRDDLAVQHATIEGEQNMSMLMTTTLVLGTVAAPVPEADFQARFQQALCELRPPVYVVDDSLVEGRINGIAEEESRFVVIDDAGRSHTFSWNDKTEWLLNGEKVSRKEALADGRAASVKHDDSKVAARVSVTTK